MSTDRPSRPQLELLSDLRVDRQERVAPPAAPEPARAGTGPAFELSVTPLSWSLPRIALLPDGAGLALTGGPVRVAVRLS